MRAWITEGCWSIPDKVAGTRIYSQADSVVVTMEHHDDDEGIQMATMLFNGLRWEVGYWDTAEGEEQIKYEYLDSYEEAMDFLTMRLVLARML